MIGLFDSGYGGLTILKALSARLPMQQFVYLGDHRNAPYGDRTPDELYELTTGNIEWLFRQRCGLVVLACNTASCVLRKIQHEWLPAHYPQNRVLGIIVPTIETVTGVPWGAVAGDKSETSAIGVFATEATVASRAYPAEIHKRAPHMRVVQQACSGLVPLIENNAPGEAVEAAVQGYVEELRSHAGGDLPGHVLLGCTHYELIKDVFRAGLSPDIRIIGQSDCVAASLENYLKRHPLRAGEKRRSAPLLFTTGDADKINRNGGRFLDGAARFTAATV